MTKNSSTDFTLLATIVTIVAEQPNFDAQEAQYTTKTTTPVATEGDEENKQYSEFSLVYFFSTFSQPIQVCIFQRSLRQRRDALKSLPGGGPPYFHPWEPAERRFFRPVLVLGTFAERGVASLRLVHSPYLLLLVSATFSVLNLGPLRSYKARSFSNRLLLRGTDLLTVYA